MIYDLLELDKTLPLEVGDVSKVSSEKTKIFPASFAYLNLSNNDCMNLRSIFSHRGQF